MKFPFLYFALAFLVGACMSPPTEFADAEFFCDCECAPVPVTVADGLTFDPLPKASVLVLRWDQNTWMEVAVCGESPNPASSEFVLGPEGLEPVSEPNSVSEQTLGPCFFTPQTGLYQFTVTAPGYKAVEKRVRLGKKADPLDVCSCTCEGVEPQHFALEPLD